MMELYSHKQCIQGLATVRGFGFQGFLNNLKSGKVPNLGFSKKITIFIRKQLDF